MSDLVFTASASRQNKRASNQHEAITSTTAMQLPQQAGCHPSIPPTAFLRWKFAQRLHSERKRNQITRIGQTGLHMHKCHTPEATRARMSHDKSLNAVALAPVCTPARCRGAVRPLPPAARCLCVRQQQCIKSGDQSRVCALERTAAGCRCTCSRTS